MKTSSLGLATVAIQLVLAGCGTDEYQRRLDSSASTSSTTSKYSCLGPDTNIPGAPANTTVSLRIPTAMSSVDVNDAARGMCPVLELPSLKATYEGFVKDTDGNKLHFYLYVCVSELGPNNHIPTHDWLDKMHGKFPGAGDDSSTDVNKNYSVPTPEGGSVQWEEFHVKGPQKFYYTKADDSPIKQDVGGTLVCLCHAENNVLVSLLFRYPSHFVDKLNRHSTDFDSDWLNLVAGCLKIKNSG